jgi:hypothetical protein
MGSSHAPARVSACLAIAALAVLPVAGGRAASPSPEPVDPFPTVETWIDGPVEAPPDASPGGSVRAGATLWNTRDHSMFSVNGLVFRLYPAKGSAGPSVAQANQDAPGHLVADLTIPKGGVGRLEVATGGTECTTDGACRDVYQPLRIAGIGPPPDAPLGSLVRAELLPITGDVVAGRPASIAVNVEPIGLWPNDAFSLPDTIEVTGTTAGGGRLDAARLGQDPPGPGQPYQGSVRILDPGQISLKAAFVDASGTTQPIAESLGPIQVIGTATRPQAGGTPRPTATGAAEAPGPGTAGEDGGPPWVILGALAVLVVGIALFLGEPLTRRLRGARGDDDRR